MTSSLVDSSNVYSTRRPLKFKYYPNYNGHNDLEIWWNSVLNCQRACGHTDAELVLILPNILVDEAIFWYFSLQNRPTTLNEFLTKLRTRFAGPEVKVKAEIEFRNRRQHENESVFEFSDSLRVLALRCGKTTSEVRSNFIYGVKQSLQIPLRTAIIINPRGDNLSLDEIVNLAATLEATFIPIESSHTTSTSLGSNLNDSYATNALSDQTNDRLSFADNVSASTSFDQHGSNYPNGNDLPCQNKPELKRAEKLDEQHYERKPELESSQATTHTQNISAEEEKTATERELISTESNLKKSELPNNLEQLRIEQSIESNQNGAINSAQVLETLEKTRISAYNVDSNNLQNDHSILQAPKERTSVLLKKYRKETSYRSTFPKVEQLQELDKENLSNNEPKQMIFEHYLKSDPDNFDTKPKILNLELRETIPKIDAKSIQWKLETNSAEDKRALSKRRRRALQSIAWH